MGAKEARRQQEVGGDGQEVFHGQSRPSGRPFLGNGSFILSQSCCPSSTERHHCVDCFLGKQNEVQG